MSALKNVRLNQPAATPQTEKAAKKQIKNAAGGFTFKVSGQDRFRRFLTMGTDGGTYYVGEQKLTDENVKFVRKYIAKHGVKVVEEIVYVSTNALAPKNTQALFALALALDSDDQAVKAAAKAAVPKVARTSTHLFEFAQFVKNNSGFGRAKTGAIANWYESKSADQVAYQAVKYRQRNGWTHADLLRLAHPKTLDANVANFILGKDVDGTVPDIINTFNELQSADSEAAILRILKSDKNATWELLPTQFLKSDKVWRQLFENGLGQTALLRNTKRMHELGLFDDMIFAAEYAKALADPEKVQKGRMHPIQYLNAYVMYAGDLIGRNYYYGGDSNAVQSPSAKITAALEQGYIQAFKNVEPANKRTMVGLDVSGSMSSPASGLKNISCATLGASMCQLISKTEPYSVFRGFSGNFVDLGINSNDSLKEVIRKTGNMNFGPTNTAAPMEWALKNKIEVDTFMIFTDNDTWQGSQHTHQALERYRQEMGINSRFMCVAAQSTSNTVANPDDAGSMDFSGFDSSTPKMIADFSAGRI